MRVTRVIRVLTQPFLQLFFRNFQIYLDPALCFFEKFLAPVEKKAAKKTQVAKHPTPIPIATHLAKRGLHTVPTR
jgi:hypothetical protein